MQCDECQCAFHAYEAGIHRLQGTFGDSHINFTIDVVTKYPFIINIHTPSYRICFMQFSKIKMPNLFTINLVVMNTKINKQT